MSRTAILISIGILCVLTLLGFSKGLMRGRGQSYLPKNTEIIRDSLHLVAEFQILADNVTGELYLDSKGTGEYFANDCEAFYFLFQNFKIICDEKELDCLKEKFLLLPKKDTIDFSPERGRF